MCNEKGIEEPTLSPNLLGCWKRFRNMEKVAVLVSLGLSQSLRGQGGTSSHRTKTMRPRCVY